jgi:hypothetical protein
MIQASPTGHTALAPDLDPPVKPSVALYAPWRPGERPVRMALT